MGWPLVVGGLIAEEAADYGMRKLTDEQKRQGLKHGKRNPKAAARQIRDRARKFKKAKMARKGAR